MFSYLGSKSKIAKLYPEPKYGLIIEPFAGSARYSLLHWENDVELYDTSPFVIEVWEYLQRASKKDILGLPSLPSKLNIETLKGLTDAERYLIGFHLCRGKAKPRKTGHGQNSWPRDRERIARDLHKIKHWKIRKGDYRGIANRLATHFIDPPYKNTQDRPGNSDRYPCPPINYDELAGYVASRDGLVIACEGEGAGYLPFQLLTTVNANTNNFDVKKTKEYVYIQGG